VLGSLGAEPDLLTVDLELDTVDAVRRSLPVLANRRI
jgi:deaminated glutathione amidase